MNSLDLYTVTQFVLISIIFILFKTGAWRKSYSTTLGLIETSIGMHLYKIGYPYYALWSIIIFAIILAIRTLLHKDFDTIIRNKPTGHVI